MRRIMPIFDEAKAIIEYLARGIEFAAALIIGIAAVEATLIGPCRELQLAADIRRTVITPSWKDIEGSNSYLKLV